MADKNFTLYLAGAEIPGWRDILAEFDSPMAVSFWGLYHRRLPKTKPYVMAEKFPGDYPLLLESGGHSANAPTVKPEYATREHLEAYAQRYEDFVADNIDRLTLVTEFDSHMLGPDWVERRRKEFYDNLDPKKFCPVWHEDDGMQVLQDLASRYSVIGLGTTAQKSGRNIGTTLNAIARSGVRLHGIGLTKPEQLRSVSFSSASSTSWLSPSQYGDTIFWDGLELHRWPRAYKERSRTSNATAFRQAGFDSDKIIAGDSKEVVRLSAWSWVQQAAALRGDRPARPATVNHRPPAPARDPFTVPTDQVTDSSDVDDEQMADGYAATEPDESVIRPPVVRNPAPVTPLVQRDKVVLLPVFGVEEVTTSEVGKDGEEILSTTRLLRSVGESTRVCDNCYVSDVCPLFQPNTSCGYNMPVEARTKEQTTAIMDGMIEMHAQRIAIMRFNEERRGGQPDPNLSVEIDRFFKLIAKKAEILDDRDFFRATIEGRGKTGTFERLFGGEPEPQRPTLEGTYQVVDPVAMIEAAVGRG
jgi:hypothetical protein